MSIDNIKIKKSDDEIMTIKTLIVKEAIILLSNTEDKAVIISADLTKTSTKENLKDIIKDKLKK